MNEMQQKEMICLNAVYNVRSCSLYTDIHTCFIAHSEPTRFLNSSVLSIPFHSISFVHVPSISMFILFHLTQSFYSFVNAFYVYKWKRKKNVGKIFRRTRAKETTTTMFSVKFILHWNAPETDGCEWIPNGICLHTKNT